MKHYLCTIMLVIMTALLGLCAASWDNGIPIDYLPLPGLDKPETVPFLIDVMQNGPDWGTELSKEYGGILPHLARCCAATNLGACKDHRAFAPLVETLRHGDFLGNKFTISFKQKEQYDIRKYAAVGLGLLGDPRAVTPLVDALENDSTDIKKCAADALGNLRDDKGALALVKVLKNPSADKELKKVSIKSLAKIRYMSAVPVMLDAAEQVSYTVGIGTDMEFMTKARLHTQYLRQNRTLTVVEFPEIGEVNTPLQIWQYWYQLGSKWTGKQFDERYKKWRDAKNNRPQEKDAISKYYMEMAEIGVTALPFIMQKIEQGETALIPLVSELTYGKVSAHAQPVEVQNWWNVNKTKWEIFDYNLPAQ